MLRSYIEQPLIDKESIIKRQKAIEELNKSLITRDELREYLSEEVKMLLIASRQYLDDCVYPNVIGLSMPLKGYELVEKTREIVTEIF